MPDFARLKWIDPVDAGRFVRREPAIGEEAEIDDLLENIGRLTDRLFDDLSVLGNFAETTARGAVPRHPACLDFTLETAQLREAERCLWGALAALREKREAFVQEQIESLPQAGRNRLHIGSAQFRISGWTNIDAGGGDFALNINWELPFDDESVDFVFSSHTLEHLRWRDQAPAFLHEIRRTLRSGGVLRLVVPDIRKLLTAYVMGDQAFFEERQRFYPLKPDFRRNGVATLDYVLLYSGVGPDMLNYNHKFGYDSETLAALLRAAGFRETRVSAFQQSAHPELRVDDHSFDANVVRSNGEHYSLFIEAVK